MIPKAKSGHAMTYSLNIGGFNGVVDRHPEKCPRCHSLIHAQGVYGSVSQHEFEVAYLCPNPPCRKLFVGQYVIKSKAPLQGILVQVLPTDVRKRGFSKEIEAISPDFCSIYNEAFAAEQNNLKQICGVGYRKALEFLIKDYLIKLHPNRVEQIKGKFLGRCVEDDIEEVKIKAVAKRATWLGNDETHYVRKWQDKDLEDLKKLLDLTVYWIDSEELTSQALVSMPE